MLHTKRFFYIWRKKTNGIMSLTLPSSTKCWSYGLTKLLLRVFLPVWCNMILHCKDDTNKYQLIYQFSIFNKIVHKLSQHGRRRIITFEFGKHIDTYFCNLEGHGSQNPLKMKLKNSGFRRNCYTGCPKKSSVTDLSDHDHKLWFWLKQKFSIYLTETDKLSISWAF